MKTTDFTHAPGVVAVLAELRSHYTATNPLVISDVLDAEGHQYVNLVQEGGGVLGIALVGYTYVLEQLGIRFLKLAGTSAGAINTMLLASVDTMPGQTKSERVTEYLANVDLFTFVDGNGFARWLIRRLVRSHNSINRIITVLAWIGLVLLTAFFVGTIALFFVPPWIVHSLATGGGLVLLLFTGVGISGAYLFSLFRRNGYGINPGRVFRKTIARWLRANGVRTLVDLEAKLHANAPKDLRMRPGRTESVEDLLTPGLDWITLITSDITTQMKIEFPKMWCLYRTNKADVNPADFVRASMSVPIFFSPFTYKKIPITNPAIKKCWKEYIGYTKPIPPEVRFVDGGVLSNFPINVFHNPSLAVPRMPTLGIRLDDSTPVVGKKRRRKKPELSPGFFNYLQAIFDTTRYYYDKDFQLRHNDFEKTIGQIDVKGMNWLNFNLTDAEKLELFRRGAEAAKLFLMGPTPATPPAFPKTERNRVTA